MKKIYASKKITKTILLAAAVLILIGVTLYSCKKVTDDVQIIISSDVIKYSTLVTIYDARDNKITPANLKMSISGQDADMVYNFLGQKDFTVKEGQMNIGLHPHLIPTSTKPASFNLEISADGYLPVTQQVSIYPNEFFKTLKVSLINLTSPPAGIKIVHKLVTLTNGKVPAQSTVKIGSGKGVNEFARKKVLATNPVPPKDSVYYDDALTSVILPQNTTFYYYKEKYALGTRLEPIYGEPIAISAKKGNVPASIVIMGGTVSASGIDALTYRPLVGFDTIAYEYFAGYEHVAYSGTVDVICITGDFSKDASVFPYQLYKPYNIKLLNNTTSPEDELLFSSAVRQPVVDIRFVGKINNNGTTQQLCLNPLNTTPVKWRTSYVLDSNFVNPNTRSKIKEGDLIEAGINYRTNESIRMHIVRADNGQLRAECTTANAGYYYNAPHKLNFEYKFETEVSTSYIPDLENLSAEYYISFNTPTKSIGGFWDRIYPNSNHPTYNYRVSSKDPLTSSANCYSRYFREQLVKPIINGSTINPFTGFQNLKNLVTFDVTLNCNVTNQKPLTVKPTYARWSTSPTDGFFYFVAVNGKWATRGLTPGSALSYEYALSKGIISFTTNSIKAGDNPIVITYTGGNNSFCNL